MFLDRNPDDHRPAPRDRIAALVEDLERDGALPNTIASLLIDRAARLRLQLERADPTRQRGFRNGGRNA